MHFTGTTVLRLKNGKIIEEIGLDNGVRALQQLGLVYVASTNSWTVLLEDRIKWAATPLVGASRDRRRCLCASLCQAPPVHYRTSALTRHVFPLGSKAAVVDVAVYFQVHHGSVERRISAYLTKIDRATFS